MAPLYQMSTKPFQTISSLPFGFASDVMQSILVSMYGKDWKDVGKLLLIGLSDAASNRT